MSGVEAEAYWLVRVGGEFVVTPGAAPGELFPQGCGNALAGLDQALHIGEWQGAPCYAIDVEALPRALAGEPVPIRAVFGLGGAEAFALVCRAAQLLDTLRGPVLGLSDTSALLPGHGPQSLMAAERSSNPYLQADYLGGIR